MTKNQIVSDLFTGKNFNECIQKMEPAHLREDLKQEVALIICEWPEDKVIKLHKDKALEFFVVRVILNQIQSNTSPFYSKYRKANLEIYNDTLATREESDALGFDPVLDHDNSHSIDGRRYMLDKINSIPDQDIYNEHTSERLLKEELEQYTMKEIDLLPFFHCEILKLYMEVGTYRAMQDKTRIPYSTCFQGVRRAIEILRKKMTSGDYKPLFSKEELKFIQDNEKDV